MAISGDMVRRVLVEFDADEAKLIKAMADIDAGNRAMAKEFGAAAAAATRALDTIGLGANAQVGKLTRLNSAFQGFTGMIGQGIGAIDNFAKTLGPWNQALELGGKAIKFLGDGMDAYAKTSPAAAAEVAKLTKEFTDLKSAVMAAVGEMTVGILKPIPSIQELERQLRGVEGAVMDAFKSYDSWNGTTKVDIGTLLTTSTRFTTALEEQAKKTKAAAEEQKKLADETERWIRAMQDAEARRFGALLAGAPGKGADALGGLAGSLSGRAGAVADKTFGQYRDNATASSDQRSLQEGMLADWGIDLEAQLRSKKPVREQSDQANFLEKHFGKIEEFDAYATAFGTLNNAVQSAMSAWISGSMSLGTAVKKGIGDALGGLAADLAGQSLRHFLYAGGSLAFGDVAGAGRHAAMGALFGAGAAATAATARKLGGSVAADMAAAKAVGGGAGSTSALPGGTSSSVGTGDSASPGVTKETYVVAYADVFAIGSERMRTRTAEQIVSRVTGGSGWSND